MINKVLHVLLFFVTSIVMGQTTTKNYILTETYNEPAREAELGNLPKDAVMTDIMYFDGLGRESQSIQLRGGGNKEDIITHHEYDVLGRQEKTFLPFSSGNDNPLFRTGEIDEQTQQYYKDNFASDFIGVTNVDNINAYTQLEYDWSPLGKVTKQSAPGKDWKLGNGKEIKTDYEHNLASEVKIYNAVTTFSNNEYVPTLTGGTTSYGIGKLYKTVVKDENWESGTNHTTETFNNKEGQIILQRNYANGAHDTYYVYDDYGNLTFVLPPKCNADSAVPTQSILKELCYQYVYDQRNRIIEKKLPGKDKEYVVYDTLDRPVLAQDGNLKSNKQWVFTKYDIQGRVAYTGIYTDSANRDRSALQEYLNNLINSETDASKRDKLFYESRVISGKGEQDCYYTNINFPNSSIEILKANYYDTYISNVNRLGTGKLTGAKTKVIGTNDWGTTNFFYNIFGQVSYQPSMFEYEDSVDMVLYIDFYFNYNFAGQVIRKTTRETQGNHVVQINDIFKYDHRRRLSRNYRCIGESNMGSFTGDLSDMNVRKSLDFPSCYSTDYDYDLVFESDINSEITAATNLVKQASNSITLKEGFFAKPNTGESLLLKIDDTEDGELIAAYDYDDIGQTVTKKIGNYHKAPLQTINYTYNVRGWLNKINNDTNADNDLFNATLHYNSPLLGGSPLYNGNISSISWSTKNYDSSTKVYNYSYDALNRLTSAVNSDSRYSLLGVSYDKNGNISSLNRKGYSSTSGANSFMDKLSYTYAPKSNKLVKVDDAGTTDFNHGFKARSSNYAYDNNGNITSDTGKGIEDITYNHLSLPERVSFNNGKHIEYKYDADGVKVAQYVKDGNNTTISSTAYLGEFIHSSRENSLFKLDIITHPEGYTERKVTPGEIEFNYFYNHKDHLGNIRLIFGDEDNSKRIEEYEIVQENNYYPFGLRHRGDNNDIISPSRNAVASRFMFGGKEITQELGLDTYDFGARNYDPALGRWMNIDPLAEMMRRHSPYNYAFNNPVYWQDPDGMMPLPPFSFAGLGGLISRVQDTWENMSNGDSFAIAYGKAVKNDETFRSIADEVPVLGEALDIAEGNYATAALGIIPGGKKVKQATEAVSDAVKTTKKATGVVKTGRKGRSGKQTRLREIMDDPKASSADRGWLKNDARHVKTGNKSGLRVPRNGRKSPGRKKADKGYELAHPSNAPASSGQSYKGSKLKNHAEHKVETRIHQKRYRNK